MQIRFLLLLVMSILVMVSCESPAKKKQESPALVEDFPTREIPIEKQDSSPPIKHTESSVQRKDTTISARKEKISSKDTIPSKPIVSDNLEAVMQNMGLIDVQSIVPQVRVELKYSTSDNFMKQDVYKDLEKAYLQEEVAGMLKQAQAYLEKEHPGYSLIIYDAARPFTVQKRMWAIVKGTNHARYVAPPDAKGSMHNYGCAVDLSVVDDKGSPLDMGTPFDFFGEAAHSTHEAELVKAGKLTQRQWDNRLILRKAMHQAGFTVLKREWWHFNAFPDATVLKRYKKIP